MKYYLRNLLCMMLATGLAMMAPVANAGEVTGTVKYIYQDSSNMILVGIQPASGSTIYLYGPSSGLKTSHVAVSNAASARETVKVSYSDTSFTFDYVVRNY